MILFSTVLRLNKNFTQDDFIKTVIEWNQNSPHPENESHGTGSGAHDMGRTSCGLR